MKQRSLFLLLATWFVMVSGCSGPTPSGPPVELTIPSGATFQEVVDTLQARGVVARPGIFKIYARLKGSDREVRSGQYAFPQPTPWSRILRDLTEGRVLTEAITIPEGFTLGPVHTN